MYGTRPCCLVQSITRHTCPDPHLGSWNCLAHQSHFASCEQMSSIDQQGSSLGSFPTPLPFIPTLIGLRAFDLVSSLVWWETLANIGEFSPASVGRVWLRAQIWLTISSGLRGAIPPGFYPLMGVGLLLGARCTPNKGNADGSKDIFRNAGRVWAAALRPDPPVKRPCAILVRWWDGWQIPNTEFSPAKHFGSQTDVQHLFIYVVLYFR